MEPIARALYAISHIVAIACFTRVGLWRQLPALFIYVAIDSVLALSYAPESKTWVAHVYLYMEPLALAMRFLCVIEAVYRIAWYRPEWKTLLLGMGLFAFAATIPIWHLDHGSSAYTFLQFRRYAQVATAVFTLTGFGVLLVAGLLRMDRYGIHALILFVLLTKQGIYSLISMRGLWTAAGWHSADRLGLMITSLCLLAWSVLALLPERRPLLVH